MKKISIILGLLLLCSSAQEFVFCVKPLNNNNGQNEGNDKKRKREEELTESKRIKTEIEREKQLTENMCFSCRKYGDSDKNGVLKVIPCDCNRSDKTVQHKCHEQCLLEWVLSSRSKLCIQCFKEFNLEDFFSKEIMRRNVGPFFDEIERTKLLNEYEIALECGLKSDNANGIVTVIKKLGEVNFLPDCLVQEAMNIIVCNTNISVESKIKAIENLILSIGKERNSYEFILNFFRRFPDKKGVEQIYNFADTILEDEMCLIITIYLGAWDKAFEILDRNWGVFSSDFLDKILIWLIRHKDFFYQTDHQKKLIHIKELIEKIITKYEKKIVYLPLIKNINLVVDVVHGNLDDYSGDFLGQMLLSLINSLENENEGLKSDGLDKPEASEKIEYICYLIEHITTKYKNKISRSFIQKWFKDIIDRASVTGCAYYTGLRPGASRCIFESFTSDMPRELCIGLFKECTRTIDNTKWAYKTLGVFLTKEDMEEVLKMATELRCKESITYLQEIIKKLEQR